jgi:hypothetical protein
MRALTGATRVARSARVDTCRHTRKPGVMVPTQGGRLAFTH